MKHLHDNTKFLQKYMTKVHEQLKMRIKFCKQRVTEYDLVMMLLEYVDHESNILIQEADKENKSTFNMQHHNPQTIKKDQQIDYLKEQIRIQAELTKNFFKQIKKQSMTDYPLPLRLSYRQSNRSQETMSPNLMLSSVNQQFLTPAFEPFNDMNDRVLGSSQKLIQSMETRINKESGRTSRITASYQEEKETKAIQNEREKSKTFAKLRKVQALFCRGQKKTISRNRSLVSQSWTLPSQHDNKIMAEENQNLKAIQNNLVTHLSIMQKYKNIPSIEELVHKEEKIRKKELELKELERNLEKRERSLNNSQIEVLKRQKSIKML